MRDAASALAWAISVPTWPHGYCENFVWNAYGAPLVIPPGGYPDANAGWDRTADKHVRDYNPPAGAPCYFSGPEGHVCLATGNGDGVYTTDRDGAGTNGFWTISGIEAAWGRTFYGWGGDIFGYPIQYINPPTESETMILIHHIVGENQAIYLASDTGFIWPGQIGGGLNLDVLQAVYGPAKVVHDMSLDSVLEAIKWNRTTIPTGSGGGGTIDYDKIKNGTAELLNNTKLHLVSG